MSNDKSNYIFIMVRSITMKYKTWCLIISNYKSMVCSITVKYKRWYFIISVLISRGSTRMLRYSGLNKTSLPLFLVFPDSPEK